MRTRSALAASALLATATLAAAAGLTGGAAHAAHPSRHPTTARAVELDITVTSTKTTVTISSTTFAPGNTVFDIVGKGGLEILSLKPGYTIENLFKDARKLFSGDVKTVRKIDKKVTFWGGAQGSKGGAHFAINLPAGSYYAANLDRGNAAPFTVTGTPVARDLPASGGKVKMVKEHTFHADASLPAKGWITITNKAAEPHFVDFAKVKKGTTAAQVRAFLLSGAEGNPPWALHEFHEALVVSPGHTFEYNLDASKGEYVELCFYPSKKTGMPHSLMGMFDISQMS